MRFALGIFALWTLVIEPTCGVFERLEQHLAPAQHERDGDNGCADLDQQIPPGQVARVQWQNEHFRIDLALPLVDPVSLMLARPHEFPTLPSLSTDPPLPYPSFVVPLRL